MDPLTDSKSRIEILEIMGNDLTVVNAARVSFAKESTEMTTQDERLIKYLAVHNHTSPFFHPMIRCRIKMPIFVAREWYRHTIGFARNEVSRRYVNDPPESYIPSPENIRERDTRKKQGSKDTAVPSCNEVFTMIDNATKASEQVYEKLLSMDVAPELARMILPQSMYTEFIETASLAAYARLCQLRLDPTAQKEIRQYAECLSKLLEEKFPVSWAALLP
jgi:thymidylate synthase (FAD)